MTDLSRLESAMLNKPRVREAAPTKLLPGQIVSPADGSLWQLDPGDPSVGIFEDALYHDGPGATDDCRTVSQDGDVDYFEAVCSCGAKYTQER